MFEWKDSAGVAVTATVTSAAGVATWTPAAAGVYYVAMRVSATADWCRLGVLEVETLTDEIEERLVKELADLDARVSDIAVIQYQISDPSGAATTRVNLMQMRRERAKAETRLNDYRRSKRGALPLRLA